MVRTSIFTLLFTACAAVAQPVITKAVNTAGYMTSGLPNGGLAQGSYIAIMGNNLGPAVSATGISVSGYPLQTNFSGVTAKIGVTDLLIVYASPAQVGAIVPSNTPLGDGPLTLTYNGQTSAALTVKVVARSLGIFTLNQAGTGPVVALKYVAADNQPPSTLLQAVNPGGILTLFGTGLGASPNPDNQYATSPTINGLNTSDIEVLIGGKPAPIQFFGRSNCCSAIDQINVMVPDNAPLGCYVSVVIRVAGIPSNSSTISIAPPGESVCSDPNGYSKEQLLAARDKGSLSTGYIGLTKASIQMSAGGTSFSSSSDALSGSFYRHTVDQLVRAQGANNAITMGSCTVYTFEGEDASSVDPITPLGLDAGASLTAQNSNGSKTLDKQASAKGTYLKTITQLGLPGGVPSIPGFETGPEYLTTGPHTVSGTGGADVGAFNASVNWPATFAWTNKDAITAVNRAAALTVNWTGGDPQGYVGISGFSVSSLGVKSAGAFFTCTESASKGTFSVPSAVLSALPASSSKQGVSLSNLSVTGISRVGSFTASGLDQGYISYQSSIAKSVPFN